MKDGDRFLLAAKKRSKQRTSNYLISTNKDDLKRTGDSFVGKLRSNFVGTEFTVYDDGAAPKEKGASDSIRNELAVVTYVRRDNHSCSGAAVMNTRASRATHLCGMVVSACRRPTCWAARAHAR